MSTAVLMKAIECSDCKALHPPPIFCCQKCGSENISEVETSGEGTVFSFTIMKFVPIGPHKSRAPYVIAVVETEKQMKLSAIVETEEPDAIKIGDKVRFKEFVEGTGFFFEKV